MSEHTSLSAEKGKTLEEEFRKINELISGMDFYDLIEKYRKALEIVEKSKFREFHDPSEIQDNLIRNLYFLIKNNKINITDEEKLKLLIDKPHNNHKPISELFSKIGIKRKYLISKLAFYEKETLENILKKITDMMIEATKEKEYSFNPIFDYISVHGELKKLSEKFNFPLEFNNKRIFLGYSEDTLESLLLLDPFVLNTDDFRKNTAKLISILKRYGGNEIRETLKKFGRIYGKNTQEFKKWAEKKQGELYDAMKKAYKKGEELEIGYCIKNFIDFSFAYKRILQETKETILEDIENAKEN